MLALAASAAFADPVLDRQALMKERGKIVGGLSKVVKGEEPFDAAAVLTQLQALQANAEKFDADALFPAGSDTGDTTASPKIWQDMAGFNAAEDKYLADVKAAVAAAPADADALKAQVGAIGSDCGTCHQGYRIKKG
ncbi:cytochrome C556 [Mesorhizobium sp. M7A.F.Ca.CA.004.05.1.1]|jgi:cytochrome c556|nr:cytochrome C556 [Mesorhizobium sp. M7A.F.Ca.CA.004.05.1.1]